METDTQERHQPSRNFKKSLRHSIGTDGMLESPNRTSTITEERVSPYTFEDGGYFTTRTFCQPLWQVGGREGVGKRDEYGPVSQHQYSLMFAHFPGKKCCLQWPSSCLLASLRGERTAVEQMLESKNTSFAPDALCASRHLSPPHNTPRQKPPSPMGLPKVINSKSFCFASLYQCQFWKTNKQQAPFILCWFQCLLPLLHWFMDVRTGHPSSSQAVLVSCVHSLAHFPCVQRE